MRIRFSSRRAKARRAQDRRFFVNLRSPLQIWKLAPKDSESLDARSGFCVDQSWTGADGRSVALAAESEHPTERRWTPERLRELAEVYLRALALGVAADELALALADVVLGDDVVRLALAVREGGEHRHARATELAGRVLDGWGAHAQ